LYLPLISNLTPTFSSQQSEVTTAVVFSYKTSTRHLPLLGATANVVPHWLNFFFSFPAPTLGQYSNRTKVKCLVIHPVVKLQNFPYKMSVGHASVVPENPERYLRPCCLKVKLTFKLT